MTDREEFDKNFSNSEFWLNPKNYPKNYNSIWKWFQSKQQEKIERVKGLIKDKRIPHQALKFGDCPNCGQEVNRKWVDITTKEIRNEAISDVLKIMEKK